MPICRVCSPGKAGIATPLTLTAPSGARQKAGRRHSFSVFGSRVSAVMATACGGFYLLGTLRIVVVVVQGPVPSYIVPPDSESVRPCAGSDD